jgi:hypothetical protein
LCADQSNPTTNVSACGFEWSYLINAAEELDVAQDGMALSVALGVLQLLKGLLQLASYVELRQRGETGAHKILLPWLYRFCLVS